MFHWLASTDAPAADLTEFISVPRNYRYDGPAVPLGTDSAQDCFVRGPTITERDRPRRVAESRVAEAQRERACANEAA